MISPSPHPRTPNPHYGRYKELPLRSHWEGRLPATGIHALRIHVAGKTRLPPILFTSLSFHLLFHPKPHQREGVEGAIALRASVVENAANAHSWVDQQNGVH